ncbi:hypothetical protein Tco_1556498 [Tanacetum coccineum]
MVILYEELSWLGLHILRVDLKQDWFKPLFEDERPATPKPAWSIPSSSLSVPTHNWASAIASSYVPPPENSLLLQTGDIGVFIDWFCKKQGIIELTPEHLEDRDKLLTNQVDDRLLSKGDRITLSITKMKAAYYLDVKLEQMVPDQMWIEAECMYDISATYGISHWWFRRQKFYIDRHSAETNRRAIIVLRRADNQEYTIAENDFKDLYPSDFEDLYLLNLQGHLNHLPPRDRKILSSAVNLWIRNLVIRQRVEDFQLGIESYQTQLNLTKPRWEATGLEFMHDYKILDSPRAVLFRDKYGMQMLMRFNEIHKFSDGTLQQIDEALDYRVKEFKVNRQSGAFFLGKNIQVSWGDPNGGIACDQALLVEEYAKETTDFYGEPNDDILSVASRTSCVIPDIASSPEGSTPGNQSTNKMLEENLPPPTRSDEQLVPIKALLPYEKSNLLLDLQKLQNNPIFRISVDILQNINFFRAFAASANVPSIYIQQCWNTLTQEAVTGVYRFQLDEHWFTLNSGLLRDALEITPVDSANPFVSPPSGEIVMGFVNELGYPEGIVTRTNVDYAELLWEEFFQGIQTFFSHRDSNKIPSKKPTPHVIPYCRFTKLLIYYLGSKYNIHMRSESPRHVTGDDFLHGNLKFVLKGKKYEVFGMPIPKELITEAIQKSEYYHLLPQSKVARVKLRKFKRERPLKLVDKDEKVHHEPEPQGEGDDPNLTRAIQISLASFQEQGQEPVGGVAIREPVSDTIQKLPVVEGKGKGIATDEQATESLLDLHKPKKKSIADQYIFQRRTPVSQATATGPSAHPEHDTSANIIRDTPSPTDAETEVDTDITNSTANTKVLYAEDVQGEEISHIVVLEEKTAELDEGQAGSDPVYLKVHESLKHTMEKHVHLENPLSSSGTLSSMKNLDDTFTFDDQFLSDKPMKEEPRKATVETEAESMVTVPIHQASTSVPPLSTPIIDLSPPKPISSPLQEPFIADTTKATTITLPLPPPSLPQSFEY